MAASGRAVRTLSTHPTVPGNNLVLSIDIELQKVVENAFGNRRGALIAMDPSTGEVLAYVFEAHIRSRTCLLMALTSKIGMS